MSGGTPAFGALLRRLRQEAGLTQEELAARAGLSVRGISDLERGVNRTARRDTALLMADAFALHGEARARFLDAARGRTEHTPVRSSPLPIPPTPLVGRETELAAVLALLARPAVRLITLTGVGGIGKTRLALEVAARAGDRYPEGVWFVDLAPLTEAELVAVAIVQALGVGVRPGQTPADALVDHFAPRRALLLLDNFEHLLGAASLVAELMRRCPAITLLITSRSPLGLRGEHVYAIPPLPLPDAAPPAAPEQALANEAVTLFVQRASAAQADFSLAAGNVRAVTEIVRRVDGLPLAIELAAARVPLLSPSAIVSRLGNRLALLTGGPRDLPPRHQTLHNAIDWSYQLLDRDTRALFRALGVFAGGAALDAAEYVAGVAALSRRRGVPAVCTSDPSSARPGDELPDPPARRGTLAPPVLDRAATLVAWGLVRRDPEPGDEPRLRMLETIREYAVHRLVHTGEAEAAHRAYVAWFLLLAERAEPELTGPEQAAWLAALDADKDNLRGALTWALGHCDGSVSLRLAGALWWYWEIRGYYAEGQSWLERALATREQEEMRGRTKALFALGAIAYRRRDLGLSERCLWEALARYRAAGDQAGTARCLAFLGLVALVRGDPDAAEEWHQAALRAAREAGDLVTVTGSLSNLGEVAHARGDLARAAALYQESLAAAELAQNPLVMARTQTNVAIVAAEQGNLPRAFALHQDALRVYREVGERRGIATCLEGIAAVDAIAGDPERAMRLFRAAATLRASIGSPQAVVEQPLYHRGIAALRDRLGEASFDQMWYAEDEPSLDEVIAEASSS